MRLVLAAERLPLGASALLPDETVSCVAAGLTTVTVGTTLGRLLALTLDGHLLAAVQLKHKDVMPMPIVHMCASPTSSCVAAANAAGTIWLWDWTLCSVRLVAPPERSADVIQSLHTLACTRRMNIYSGSLFYTCKPGSIHVVELNPPQTHSGQPDYTGDQGTPRAPIIGPDGTLCLTSKTHPYIDRLMLMVGDPAVPLPPIRHVLAEGPVLLFAVRHRLLAYNFQSGSVVAAFWHFDSDRPRSRSQPPAPPASLHDSAAAQRDGSVAEHEVADNVPSICGLATAGETLLVQYPRWVFLLSRQKLDHTPFQVLRVVPLPGQCSAAVNFGPVIFSFGVPDEALDLADKATIAAPPSLEEAVSATAASTAATAVTASTARMFIQSAENYALLQSMALPPGVDGIVGHSACFALQSPDTEGYGTFAATHVFLAVSRSLIVLRAIRPSEQVAVLAHRGHYALAQHMCQQRLRRPRVLVEISNAYACSLWHQHKYSEAMTVWGEQVLPSAPAAFWRIFVERLIAAGQLNLLVKWLPFNDRSKVSAHVYETLLLQPLRDGSWATLLSRIARWPVLYSLPRVASAISDVLVTLNLTVASWMDCVALLTSEHVSADGTVDWAAVHASAVAKGRTLLAPQGTRAVHVELLLLALYKLFHFDSQHVECFEMLLVLKMVNGARSASEPNLASWVADDESHFLALQRVLEMVGAETVESALEKPALWRAIDAGSAAGADAAADGTKLTSPNAAQTSTPERTRPAAAAAAAAASPGQRIPTAVAKRSTANSVSDTDAYFTPPASPGRELFSDGAAPGADDTICADTLDESLVSSVCGEEPVAGFWPPNVIFQQPRRLAAMWLAAAMFSKEGKASLAQHFESRPALVWISAVQQGLVDLGLKVGIKSIIGGFA